MTRSKRDEALHSAELEEGCTVLAGHPALKERSRTIYAVRDALVSRGYEASRAYRIAEKLVEQLPAIEQSL